MNIIVWGLLFCCIFWCCIYLIHHRCKRKPQPKQPEPEVSKKEVKKLIKLDNQNKTLQIEIQNLTSALQQDNQLLQEADDLSDIISENEDLKEQNKILSDNLKAIQRQIIYESSDSDEAPGPISLIIGGGASLQELSILASPTMPMGEVLRLFCAQKNMVRDQWVFYRVDNNKKKSKVDETKSAHENGFVNGSRVFIENDV